MWHRAALSSRVAAAGGRGRSHTLTLTPNANPNRGRSHTPERDATIPARVTAMVAGRVA